VLVTGIAERVSETALRISVGLFVR